MAPFNNKTVLWGALAGVVLVVALVVWWTGGGEREKGAPRSGGREQTAARQKDSRDSFWARLRSGGFSQGSPSASLEPKDIEEAVRRTFRAYNRQDLPAFKDGWTEGGFQQAYGLPKEKAMGLDQLSLLSFRPYTVGEFTNTSVNGEGAATEVGLTYGEVHETHRMSLLREGDRWKIDHDEKLDLIPRDAAVVDAKFQYFKIQLDRTQAAPGSVAFRISNADTQQHEFIVKKISDSESEDTIGKIKPLKPGQSETLVLTNLMPGRYVILCNMLSRDGVPYAYGMRTEFRIE